MKFRNDNDHPVSFKARGKTYEAAPKGGEVSLPDDIAYVVEAMKVPLVSADSPKPVPPADPPPAKSSKEKAGDK
jgi:hypothetical protein